jgi:hypothetical protein
MALTLHTLSAIAARVDHPFSLISLGLVGDISLNLYVAQGQVDWHKHIDEDELFLVHEGALQIESELGNTTLYAEEAMLVPKGVGHRSSSAMRSIVLLFRQQILPERKNGHRNYLVVGDDAPLKKARLGIIAQKLDQPYWPQPVARIEGYQLSVSAARDFGPTETARRGGTMIYALREAMSIELDPGGVRLVQGQLVILPARAPYKLHCAQPAVVVKFEHE